jgi:hypothetical protein
MSKNNKIVFDGKIYLEITKEQAREIYDLYFEILQVSYAYNETNIKHYHKCRDGKKFFLGLDSIKYFVSEYSYNMYNNK